MDKISFWELLEKYKVVIPIIQRDYAQGRVGKEHIREKFLTQIKNALDASSQSGELDFVYGTVKDGCFYPLDGQQRLTTLWLLHWFIASKAGKLNEAKDTLKKFSYETRTSSREFCKKLCDFDISKVADAIQKQTWFYSAWKQDPTIQSMLRMLEGTDVKDEKGNDFIDGIEELFYNCPPEYYEKAWDILTGDCPVKFYKLEINSAELPVSDDLYIKMNARGKPLTSFENLKADLIDYIEKDNNNIINDSVNGFAVKIDTDWTDIFWDKKSSVNSIDEIYFAFINRIFFSDICLAKQDDIYLIKSKNENENRTYKYLNNEKSSYQSLDDYTYLNGTIPQETFENIYNIMNAVCTYYNKKWWSKIFCCPWDKTFRFIPEYVKDGEEQEIIVEDKSGNRVREVTTLSQPQRVVFFAICKFLKECRNNKEEDVEKALIRWMRVVWNLVSVEAGDGKSVIRSFDSMRGAMELINSLDSQDVYSSLEKIELSKDSQLIQQYNEEVEKAKQIKSHPEYENKIINAEKYAFFNGAIRFLYRNENGEEKWDGFAKKFENAQSYFENDGLKESEYPSRNKILISFCSDWETQLKRRYLFGKKSKNWRSILLDQNLCNPVHHLLSGDQFNQSMQIDNCEWLNNVINNDDEIWDEIDPKVIDSYQLEWQWNAPCLWLSHYPAATIRIYDTEKDKFQKIVRQADSKNSILSEKYFRNKDYEFSINNKKYIWHPWSGMVSFNDRQMPIDDFEKHLGGCLNGNFHNS